MKIVTNYKLQVTFFALLLFCFSALFAQTKADTIHVSHYDINLEIRNFGQQEINGYTDITIEAKMAPLSNIYLHLLALTVDSVKNGNTHITFSRQGQQLKIGLPFSAVGQKHTIRIYYYGKPVKDPQWGGFYFTSDFAYNMGVGMGSYPHSFGRVWFPCIDEFTDKSTYTFNITTDLDKKAVCGGKLVDSTNLGNAMLWKWKLTEKIPTYLASVAVGEYQVYKDTVHSSISGEILPVEIYANPTYIQKVPGSFANLKKFIHIYEKRWGACRWQRVGYVVVPFSGGAMEHATNIAFPQYAVSGNTNNSNYQSLISHELAHSWFGNLITCATSQNMWINEGFARYGEYLCDELLDSSLEKYKTGIRKLHFDVLKNDGGNYALDNVPTNATYGSTTYDKGGLVAYTLRHYMGDDLYFSSITQLLNDNQYGNIDSKEFFSKLSQFSGIDLHDFYLGWVHQKGFLNFNIDSIKPKGGNIYEISFKQKLYHAEKYANKNKVDVEFLSDSGERYLVEKIEFSKESDMVQVAIPFKPVFWSIDPNGKLGDACFDFTQILNKTGTTNLGDASFKVQVSEIVGESILRVEHNPVAPTSSKNKHPNVVKISEKHFWRIGFLQYNAMQAKYSFNYNTNSYEKELLQGYTKEDLILLYRKDASHNWQIIPATLTVTNLITGTGSLDVDFILPGEYTFAIGGDVKVREWENDVVIYPNPVRDELRIANYELRIDGVEIFDVMGRMQKVEYGKQKTEWILDVSNVSVGTYFIQIQTDKGTIIKKMIKN